MKGTVDNLTHGVTSAAGKCLPALTTLRNANPIPSPPIGSSAAAALPTGITPAGQLPRGANRDVDRGNVPGLRRDRYARCERWCSRDRSRFRFRRGED